MKDCYRRGRTLAHKKTPPPHQNILNTNTEEIRRKKRTEYRNKVKNRRGNERNEAENVKNTQDKLNTRLNRGKNRKKMNNITRKM